VVRVGGEVFSVAAAPGFRMCILCKTNRYSTLDKP